ncbi:MAG: hypothetical protein LBL92_03015, partial [Propionibacteriaceae bacterium]|nr:hypothetical protein [Propionibacteriaceae bacterium]
MPIRRRTDTALSPVKSRRKPLIIGLAIALVLVVGGVIAWWLGHRSDDDPTTVTKTNTATVQRGSLAAGFKLSGTIGYGDAEPLSGASTGIVTKVP